MMGHKERMIDGDETDALTRWKEYLNWKPGERKKIKRKYNKRTRKQAKINLYNLVQVRFLLVN